MDEFAGTEIVVEATDCEVCDSEDARIKRDKYRDGDSVWYVHCTDCGSTRFTDPPT